MRTHHTRRTLRGTTGIAAALLLAGSLAGCSGDSGSVEAFCGVIAEHKTDYVDAMKTATDAADPVSGLLGAISAMGNLTVMWAELAEAAPADIRAEVETVSDSWADTQDAAASGDFLGAVSGTLLNSQPMESVDAYVVENCGPEFKMF